MSSKTATKTKQKVSIKDKVAVGLMTAGAIALAAAAIIGGKKSTLSIYQKILRPVPEISANTNQAVIAEIYFSAGDKDVEVTGIPVEVNFKSGFDKNKNLIRNINLYTDNKSCFIVPENSYGYNYYNTEPGNYYCHAPVYGYGQLVKVGSRDRFDKLWSHGKAGFAIAGKFVIPANQTRSIIVKADVGSVSEVESILVSLSAYDIKANYANGARAVRKVQNGQWKKIVPQQLPEPVIEPELFKINLLKGWNFISLPAEPENPAIESVLADIKGKYQQVKTQTQSATVSGNSINGDLKEIHAGEGFQIKMNEEGTIAVKEQVAATIFFLPITQDGWNWTGLKSFDKKKISESVDLNKFLEIRTFNAGAEDPSIEEKSYPADFTEFEPGKGYKIRYSSVGRIIGDADGDGKITKEDATLILKMSVGSVQKPDNICSVDIDKDGKIIAADALYVLKYAEGKISESGNVGKLCGE